MKKFKNVMLIFFAASLWASAQTADDEAVYKLAVRAFNDRAYNFSVNKLEVLLRDFPGSSYRAGALYYTGVSYFYLAETEKAADSFAALTKEFPLDAFSAKSRWWICKSLYDQKKYSQALDEARSSLKNYSKGEYNGRIQILIGDIYLALGQIDDALSQYRSVTGADLDEARYKAAMVAYDNGEYAQAERELTDLMVRMTDVSALEKVLYTKAKTVFYLKRWEDSAREFDSFLLKFPDSKYSEEIRFYKVYTPFERSNFTEAAAGLQAWIEATPQSEWRDAAIYYSGRSQEELGQEVLALEQYARLSSDTNSSYWGGTMKRMYVMYQNQQNTARCREILERLMKAPSSADREFALKETAFLYLESDPAKAEQYFAQIVSNASGGRASFEIYQWYSYALLKKGNTERAVSVLEDAYRKFPASAEKLEVLRLLGDNLVKLGNFEKARTYYARIVKEFPEDPKKDYGTEGVAWTWYMQKEYSRAQESYKELKKSQIPELRSAAWFTSAEILRLLGDPGKAVSEFNAFRRSFPDDRRAAEAGFRAARILYDQKEYGDSASLYQEILASSTKSEDKTKALNGLGWCAYHSGDEDGALNWFIKLKDADPSFSSVLTGDAFLTAGKILYNQKQYQRALDIQIELINSGAGAESNTLAEAHSEVVMCFLQTGNDKQARWFTEKLAREYPQRGDLIAYSQRSLAEYLIQKNRQAEAMELYFAIAKAAADKGSQAEALYWAGDCAYASADKKKAEDTWRKVIELGATDFLMDAKNALAGLYEESGRKDESSRLYEEVRKSGRKDLSVKANANAAKVTKNTEKSSVSTLSDSAKLKELLKTLTDPEAKADCNIKIAKSLGASDEAVKYWKNAADLSPGRSGAQAQLEAVRILFDKKDYKRAYEEGQSLRYLFLDYTDIIDSEDALFMAAFAASQTGNKNDARELFEKLKKKYPSGKYADRIPK